VPRKRQPVQRHDRTYSSQRQLLEEMGRAAGLSPEEMERRWRELLARSPWLAPQPNASICPVPDEGERTRGATGKVTVRFKAPLGSKLGALKPKWRLTMPPSTWSISRDSILHSCERRYYFQYLVTARYNSKKPLNREVALLKQLQSIPAWQGDCFHAAVGRWANAARTNRDQSIKHMLDELKGDMKRQWQQSVSLKGQAKPTSDVSCRLFEHEYGVELAEDQLETAIAQTCKWIESFLAWAENVGLRRAVQAATKYWIEPDPFGPAAPGFKVEGQQVLVKVDLALQTRQGMFEIWDWKTGKVGNSNPRRIDPAALQVNVYQLWPHFQFGVPLENIRAHLVYVAQQPVEDIVYEIDADVREYVLSVVRRSLDRVVHFSGKKSEAGFDIADFDYAIASGMCRACNFKRICLRSVGGEV
jgi:PD-(D/E)XK nuclease superfamily protein